MSSETFSSHASLITGAMLNPAMQMIVQLFMDSGRYATHETKELGNA